MESVAVPRPPRPLTVEEEATLAFAAYGVTGPVLAELPYTPGDVPAGAVAAWRDGGAVQVGIPRYPDEAIAATIADCEYVYDRFYRPDALTDTQRRDAPADD
ncbi:MAG TPA: hypothetical protein VFL91_19035 [Thermomicrobiales bacterium]|nr:hypothetical protein [Thermomicrobiales bacterium]